MRIYARTEVCGFRYSAAQWGELSNFFPLAVPIAAGPWRFATSEAVYQAAKFAAHPDVQQRIAEAPTPKAAAAIGRTPGLGIDPGWNAQRVDVMRWVLRMRGDAADVQTVLALTGSQRVSKRLAQRGRPLALEGQQATENRDERLRRIGSLCIGDRQTRPMQPAHARHLVPGVAHLARIRRLLRLEHGVDALGRNDRLPFVAEYERRVLAIEHDDVDLLAERAQAVHDVRRRGPIALRQVFLEQFQPHPLARIALHDGMTEALADPPQALLDVVVQLREQPCQRPLAHDPPSRNGAVAAIARAVCSALSGSTAVAG